MFRRSLSSLSSFSKAFTRPTLPRKTITRRFRATTILSHPTPLPTTTEPQLNQGITGDCTLIAGDFKYFLPSEAQAIAELLPHRKVFVLLFDRDNISVPANERASWILEHFKHHPNLEVRVGYGAPMPDRKANTDFNRYVTQQIPGLINVKSVCVTNENSHALAEELSCALFYNRRLLDNHHLADLIDSNIEQHQHYLYPHVARRYQASFQQAMDAEAFVNDVQNHVPTVITTLNQQYQANHPNKAIFYQRVPWDLQGVAHRNLPIVIGALTDSQAQSEFSKPGNIQVFDMPVYIPGQGWRIPLELAPYRSVMAQIVAAEMLSNPDIENYNAYITIDQGVVHPNGYARRDGLHIDGFLTSNNKSNNTVWGDSTYIISDNTDLQTDFYPGPFNLAGINYNDPQAVINAFNSQGLLMQPVQGNPYEIVRMTTNHVHAVHQNTTGQYLRRAFLKMTFSERLFNRGGNTYNPLLDYRFTYVPRGNQRNTQNFAGDVPEGYLDVNLDDIGFLYEKSPDWLSPHLLTVTKNPSVVVTAKSATPGEVLETRVNGDLVTTNIARAGDMKLTRTDGDSYFLGKKFTRLYSHTEKDRFLPIPRDLYAREVLKDISFIASWGTRQHIKKGGMLVQEIGDNPRNEKWGVHKESFAATYQRR